MPRGKVVVAKYFSLCPVNEGEKLPKVKCVFCGDQIANNGTRMVQHIKRCKNLSDSRRQNCLGNTNSQSIISMSTSVDLEVSSNKESSSESGGVDETTNACSSRSTTTRKCSLSLGSAATHRVDSETERTPAKRQNSNIASFFGDIGSRSGGNDKISSYATLSTSSNSSMKKSSASSNTNLSNRVTNYFDFMSEEEQVSK